MPVEEKEQLKFIEAPSTHTHPALVVLAERGQSSYHS